MPHRAPSYVAALALVACAHARDASEPPAAMVGIPSPIVTAPPPASEPAPSAPPIGTHTRTIADPPPPPAYVGRKMDLDVKDADIHNVLRLIADVGRVNIVVGDDVTGSVTVRM